MDTENDILEELEIRETLDGRETGRMRSAARRAQASGEASPSGTGPAQSSPAGLGRLQGLAAATADPKRNQALAKKKGRPDPYIWGIYIMLLVISVVELFSASSTEVSGNNIYAPLLRHGMFLLIGFGIVLWLQRTPYMVFHKFAWAFAIFSLGLLLVSSLIGVEYNGAQRAIQVAGITIQPAEIAKLSVVILLASILGKNQTPGGVTNKGVVTAAAVVVVFSACLWRNGLTNTILLMIVNIAMMIIGGVQWKKMGVVMLVYALLAVLLVSFKYIAPSSTEFDSVAEQQQLLAESGGGAVVGNSSGQIDRTGTQIGRVKRFLKGVKPTDRIDDINRQVIFAKFSQANGGLFGQGPGNSRESARLPLAFSDYIYSIIVEDTGFVGGAGVLLLYLLLLARAGRIAYKCQRAFPAFLILGCAVMIVFQALVHMAIVTGLFPVSGQPLPFISKGGTSVIVMSAALGVMLSVARFASHSQGTRQIHTAEKNALPADMQAANFSAQR